MKSIRYLLRQPFFITSTTSHSPAQMQKLKSFTIICLLGALFFSCRNSTGTQESNSFPEAPEIDSSAVITSPVMDSIAVNTKLITAKFIGFSLGDVGHYMFEDATGKTWDFAENEDLYITFAMELSEDQADESNQGWGSEKSLQGQWFDIKYEYRDQPLYEDGPITSVLVILSVTLKE